MNNSVRVTRGSAIAKWLVGFCAVCVCTALLSCVGWGVLAGPGARETALDRYVAKPDSHYKYELVNTIKEPEYTAYVLDMTSQSWRSSEEVDRTLWQHWVTIIEPKKIETSKGLLFIGGGKNGGDPPTTVSGMLSKIAVETKSVVTELRMVPNQPLKFADEQFEEYKEEGRYEDDLIAYTWDKYLKTGDELWPARLPMVKSAVRAMDTVTSFCGSEEGGGIQVREFVVAGGSKRGWTTWMTAAVDKRVVGIVPIVIDLLNLQVSFEHHWRAYGFWAPAVSDYVEMGIMDYMGDPRFTRLMKLVEPYEYRSRLTMPKLLINATGDQFFLPDSSQFYFDDLRGVKYLRYVPNGDHGLDETDAAESLMAFYNAILYERPLPKYSWSLSPDGAIQVKTKDAPTEVKLWQATNPETRDFRLETIGKVWQETVLSGSDGGMFIGKVIPPVKGWTAFMVELTFDWEGPAPLKFTTEVRVVPDTLPYSFPPSPGGASSADTQR
ncbi:MAG: PhoPQ-activated pathogenicity-related family protein [bacterium]